MGKKKDIIHLERESVIPIIKHKLISTLSDHIEQKSDRDEFLKLCQRVEYTIRAWYLLHFEDLMTLYALFEPIYGAKKLKQHNLTPEEIDSCEQQFLTCLFQIMDKSNFKISTDEEIDVALSAEYRLNLPIVVDESKLDKKLFTDYFSKNPHENLPYFADKSEDKKRRVLLFFLEKKMGKKKDIIHLERESVIPIIKHKLISTLSDHIEQKSDRDEFLKLCQRVEYTIRAWYLLHFEDLMTLYALFEPIYGAKKLKQHNLTPEEIDSCEQQFLTCLFQIMDKSNFKISTDEEIDVALSAEYRLNLPIVVDESKLDKKLFTDYFSKNPHENLPYFADKFIVFRRGFGIDQMTAYFIKAKINTILWRMWKFFMRITGLKVCFKKSGTQHKKDPKPKPIQIHIEEDDSDLYVERIRIEKMNLSFSNLIGQVTIQEPTFQSIIVVYRRASSKKETERNIYVKHFRNIPMADMEIALPEKKNPGLTPMDWVKFIGSAAVGLVTVIGSLHVRKADIRVIFAILSSVVGYCVKTYFTFQSNLVSYQSLITQSVYDKQLDSGRGTLLHLCDDVIQQEELDLRCEDLIKQDFGEDCNFDVDDAVQKLEKLGIVTQDTAGNYACVDIKQANEIIGTTTEEVVLKARHGNISSRYSGLGGSSSSSSSRFSGLGVMSEFTHY
ncbi:hypothetical protein JCGZ_26885 [Jatropha curcas]|uniref:Aminopeptidase n=1 Tax=Jatropha curcas TaxID=180498 RepID=A0A067L0C1_JATCU|nr:hypothetical protein JCGZ_26885 [Jatropha curcas]